MAKRIVDRLRAQFGAAILADDAQHGNESVTVEPGRLVEVASFLRDDAQLALDMPIDCTAVDLMGLPAQARFQVLWHVYSVRLRHRLRLRLHVDEARDEVPSLVAVWPGMNWHEREAWDLYGITFLGHPDLRRILTYDGFEGHPLRRDYPIDRRQPLITMRKVREVPTQRHPTPEMLNRP